MDFEACVYYLQLRLLLLRLYHRISVFTQQRSTSTTNEAWSDPQVKVHGLAKNIAMSWGEGYDRCQLGRVRLALALPAFWASVLDFRTFGPFSLNETYSWICP